MYSLCSLCVSVVDPFRIMIHHRGTESHRDCTGIFVFAKTLSKVRAYGMVNVEAVT
jgi:hypothetical protein